MSTNFPERIGRYRVVSLLGHGAMGNVFLAEDPLLKRKLAIKVVRIQGDEGDRTLERFEREAQISARLSHPNIITIFDVGQDPGVGIFLAMEYIQGASLASLIRDKRPGPETGLFILLQGMRALQAAADAGIVHRDIKPENMMVSDQGRLKLMDFGLARGEDNRLTATGVFMGTPSFTAPELLLGKEPNVETDRYAFAVTAFELLLGQLPFPATNLGVTLYKIVHDPPLFPEGTPPALVATLTKALAKDPAARYGDLTALMRDLILGSPVSEGTRRKLLGFLEPESPDEALATDTIPDASRTPSTPPSASVLPGAITQVPAAARPSSPLPASHPPAVAEPRRAPLARPSPLIPGTRAAAGQPSRPASPNPRLSPILPILPRPASQPPVTRPPVPLLPPLKPRTNPPAKPAVAPRLNVPLAPRPASRPSSSSPKPPLGSAENPPALALLSADDPSANSSSDILPPLTALSPSEPGTHAEGPHSSSAPPKSLEEPLTLGDDIFEDDPFSGLDWDEILKPLPTASEHLYHELEEDLAGMELGDVLRAGDHIEAEELVNQLERDLADTQIPEVEAPRRRPVHNLPPPPQFPKLR